MHDILPEEQKYWRYILKKSASLADDYNFEKIDTPILEQTELFIRSASIGTDVVDKELYSLKTKGGDDLTLRPEGTASIVRAYLENGMNVRPQDRKLYFYCPMFNHRYPQPGRFRHHLS